MHPMLNVNPVAPAVERKRLEQRGVRTAHQVPFTHRPSVPRGAMNLLATLAAIVQPGPVPFCDQDPSEARFPMHLSAHISRKRLIDDVLQPSLDRAQNDICQCLPRWRRQWPTSVRAHLHIAPNEGTVRIEYRIENPTPPPIRRMLACMAEPTLTFEPIPYVSDIILPDGSRGQFPVYPFLFVLSEPAVSP